MIKVKEIAFVCYAVTDIKKSKDFYGNILGLKEGMKWESDEFAFIEYDLGPNGSQTVAIGFGASYFKPGPGGCSAALEVEDFDATVKHLKEKNVKFEMLPQDTPVCHMAVIHDPDGNQIMIHHRKEK